MNHLCSLAAASLLEHVLPLNFGLVVGVNACVGVDSVLQGLSGGGIQHGPLRNGKQELGKSC